MTVFCLIAAIPAWADPLADLQARYRRPDAIPSPADNPFSEAKAALGRKLFFDPRLSGSGNTACASCHQPDHAWGSPPERPLGDNGGPLARRPPSLLDVAWSESFMWDGREPSLEAQVLEPLGDPGTMGDGLARIAADPDYRRAFGDEPVSLGAVARAIATFERTLASPPSAFDRWIAGDARALTEPAQRGFLLFNDLRHRCADCHSGWRFTDGTFRDTGLSGTDRGRGKTASAIAFDRAFKTPGLRHVSAGGPFFHDASARDLDAVLDHYASGFIRRPSLAEYIKGFDLNPADRDAFKAFLASLAQP